MGIACCVERSQKWEEPITFDHWIAVKSETNMYKKAKLLRPIFDKIDQDHNEKIKKVELR